MRYSVLWTVVQGQTRAAGLLQDGSCQPSPFVPRIVLDNLVLHDSSPHGVPRTGQTPYAAAAL
jgi:hypothetical protein